MTRPLIGLPGRRKVGTQVIGTPESLQHLEADFYYADYARGVLEAGGLPVHLPLDAAPELFVGRIDGIVLPGGADVGPERYGAESETDEFPPESIRDDYELALYQAATNADLPVLGICRGLQVINVASGGTLHQHVPSHSAFDRPPTTLLHTVRIDADSALGRMYGTSHDTNSLHHQTVDTIGTDLRVTARTSDGTVEGFEHEHLPVIAVQWHPEMLPTRPNDPVFSWIVEAAGRRRES